MSPLSLDLALSLINCTCDAYPLSRFLGMFVTGPPLFVHTCLIHCSFPLDCVRKHEMVYPLLIHKWAQYMTRKNKSST